ELLFSTFNDKEILPGIVTRVKRPEWVEDPVGWSTPFLDLFVHLYGDDGLSFGHVAFSWTPEFAENTIRVEAALTKHRGQGVYTAVLRQLSNIIPAGTILDGGIGNFETLCQLAVMALRHQIPGDHWNTISLAYDRDRDGAHYVEHLRRKLLDLAS